MANVTETTIGVIPNLYCSELGLWLAVKIDANAKKTKDYMYPPLVRDGKLVYALPGGGEFTQKDGKQ